MLYKEVHPGQLFSVWQILETGSQTRICVKTQDGQAVDLNSGEVIHIQHNKKVEPALRLSAGQVALCKDRPCFASARSEGRAFVEYFVIFSTETVPESLVKPVKHDAKPAGLPPEVDIIIQAGITMIRKCAKILRSQADSLESARDVDIMP